MGQQSRLSAIYHWFCCGSGECVAVSLPMLQEWRGRLFDTLPPNASPGGNAPLLHGSHSGSIQQTGSHKPVENLSNLQRYESCPTVQKLSIAYPFAGVGYCAVFIAYYVSFYYNVIIGWSFFYLGSSISWSLPWNSCNNTWNTEVKTCPIVQMSSPNK